MAESKPMMQIPTNVLRIAELCPIATSPSDRRPWYGLAMKTEGEDNEKSMAVATDGARLLLVRFPNHERKKFECVMDPATAKMLIAMFDQRPEVGPSTIAIKSKSSRADKRIILSSKNRENTTAKVEAKEIAVFEEYPKYQEVIPDYAIGEDAVEIHVDPSLLVGLLQTMCKLYENSKTQRMRMIIPKSPRRPIVVKLDIEESGLSATGVCMPAIL